MVKGKGVNKYRSRRKVVKVQRVPIHDHQLVNDDFFYDENEINIAGEILEINKEEVRQSEDEASSIEDCNIIDYENNKKSLEDEDNEEDEEEKDDAILEDILIPICPNFDINHEIDKEIKIADSRNLPDDFNTPLIQGNSLTKGEFTNEIKKKYIEKYWRN